MDIPNELLEDLPSEEEVELILSEQSLLQHYIRDRISLVEEDIVLSAVLSEAERITDLLRGSLN